MNYREYQPHPVLQDTVKCFWTHEATYAADQLQSITPDGCVELIFNFGSPYLLFTATPPQVLPAAVLVGFQKKTLPIRVDGTVKVVAARLFAWGALALLREEICTHVGAVTALDVGWDMLVQRLESHVTQGRYEEARATLQEFLLPRARCALMISKLVSNRGQVVVSHQGPVSNRGACQLLPCIGAATGTEVSARRRRLAEDLRPHAPL